MSEYDASQEAKKLTEEIMYQGRILEVVEQAQADGRVFEFARRAPGVRVIIPSPDGQQILLTREHRREASGYDYRLPGGKVFDKLAQYNEFLASGKDILDAASSKVREEAGQEAGVDIEKSVHIVTANCGATVDWDLYYFEATKWTESAQDLEEGEDIALEWLDVDQVKQILFSGQMQEYRSAGVLTQWLAARGELK